MLAARSLGGLNLLNVTPREISRVERNWAARSPKPIALGDAIMIFRALAMHTPQALG